MTSALQVGKRADLILVEGNPLQDVKRLSDLKGVMVDGRWLAEDDLRAMLDNVAREYRQAESDVAEPGGGHK